MSAAKLRFAVVCAGIIAALWVVFGRGLVGGLGSLTVIYCLILGLPIIVLHTLVAHTLVRTARVGHATRPWTIITLIIAWLCFAMLGLLIPDRLADGTLHTMITGNSATWTGFAIGIANPMGIIGIALCVASLILALGDVRGPRPSEDDILDALQDNGIGKLENTD